MKEGRGAHVSNVFDCFSWVFDTREESTPGLLVLRRPDLLIQRDWYFIAEQPAPAPHLAHPEGCAALRIVLVTVPRVSRSCELFPDGFDLHLLHLL